MTYGPSLSISKELHQSKYRGDGEPFEDSCYRVSSTLSDNDRHRHALSDILLNMRFLPGGRVQAAIGSPRRLTPYNCFVSKSIADDFKDIMVAATEAGQTMRLGGGIGYDFSTLRPRGSLIKSLNSYSSGPVSFMDIFNAICGTISSAGHRRGAQMGVLNVTHPDIEEFVHAKRNSDNLTRFNISVGITDDFMEAVKQGTDFNLKFKGRVFKTIDARTLWEAILRSTWSWAEPGVLFIDRINEWNNLWYCETIAATNPCGEQPLPPYGACLLGSINLVKYVTYDRRFDFDLLRADIPHIIRAMDNINDVAIFPLPQQEEEARSKRRMGIGITGLANTLEFLGYEYGSVDFLASMSDILVTLRDVAYSTSVELAKEKGTFPLYDKERFLDGKFIRTLPNDLRRSMARHGIRNSHLLSIAPTGTISLVADNVSSGIEPVYTYQYSRVIQTFQGPITEEVTDYGYREWAVKGRKAEDVPVQDHVRVLTTAQRFVDSAVSKTCNVGPDVGWDEFKGVYLQAFDGGAKGCTTFRSSGLRVGILRETPPKEFVGDEDELVCMIDPVTGLKSCG